MSVHVHHLTGCAPEPLAHYLKALGILRVLCKPDPRVRGWWSGESFHLATRLDRQEMLRFFLEDYSPTPILGPWGARSGFFDTPSERAAREAQDEIIDADLPRLQPMQEAIQRIRNCMVRHGIAEKPGGREKEAFMRLLRRELPERDREWLDACVLLGESASYPALLGTGGNEGSGSYSSNFLQVIVETIIERRWDLLLPEALEAQAVQAKPNVLAGQFLPMATDPPNGGNGFRGGLAMNPWDYMFCLEGACTFIPSAARYEAVGSGVRATAPFVARSAAAGYGSAAEGEKNRGEQWFPLWSRPATYPEIRGMIAEGRSRVGRAGAGRPVDFGRAIARLGVARGITAFQRYGYIERNGQSNLAVPLGRWPVSAQPHVDLLDQVAGWVQSLARAARAGHAPASVARHAQACEEAMLAVTRPGAGARHWRALLVALGEAEAALPRSPRFTAERRLRPLPRLSETWVHAAAEDRPELRLAVALAGQFGPDSEGRLDRSWTVRRNFLPLAEPCDGRRPRFAGILRQAETACIANDLAADATALVNRRIQEAGRHGWPRLPLVPIPGTEATAHDLAQLLAGELDEALILSLARAFMAVGWRGRFRWQSPAAAGASYARDLGPHGLFVLAYHWAPLSLVPGAAPIAVPLDPTPLARLIAGDLPRATEAVCRRLTAAGLPPYMRTAVGDAPSARRMAMALAFPVGPHTIRHLARSFTRVSSDPGGAADSNNPEQEMQIS